jgi:heat shock protein HspQ
MGTVTDIRCARFAVGDLVHHRLFDYRGVVVDVDPTFQGTEDWYEAMARSRPPKDRPWYHVLVNGASHMTYVAERNLQKDTTGQPISHPLLDRFFAGFEDGRYVIGDQRTN